MMQQHDSTHSCQCDVCKVKYFERNNYFHGKMLNARDLRAEQEYFNEKRWLINRMILGWGIVCGLEVKLDYGCLVVEPGLALDCCGHELLVCERQALHPNKIAEQLEIDPNKSYGPINWVLCLEYRECRTEPVKLLNAACEESERGEYNRIRDHYRLRFRPRYENQGQDPTNDEACPEDHDDFYCPYHNLGRESSIHRALVDASRECPKCESCECVVLATGTLEPNRGQDPEIKVDDDSWKYRRIVYTNPSLANLVRCLHPQLAHISNINWKWEPGAHYNVDEFLRLLTQDYLQITFDRPMNQGTVEDTRTLRLSIYLPIYDHNCPVHFLIPLDHVEYQDNVATYYFDDDCIEHDLRSACKKLLKPAEVEIALHGSMVRDYYDRALDAELIRGFPTGNGVEGGEFITYFTVRPMRSGSSY